jgi:hypothetical protein
MRKNILDYWAGLSFATAGFTTFTFFNLVFYGAVLYHEKLFISIIELLLSLFIFTLNAYILWKILIKKKEVILR